MTNRCRRHAATPELAELTLLKNWLQFQLSTKTGYLFRILGVDLDETNIQVGEADISRDKFACLTLLSCR